VDPTSAVPAWEVAQRNSVSADCRGHETASIDVSDSAELLEVKDCSSIAGAFSFRNNDLNEPAGAADAARGLTDR